MIKPIEISPGVWRGAQPSSIDDWKTLARLGIKYTLDLETGSHLLSDGSPLQEYFTAESYGIKSFSHPLGEILPPTNKELSYALRAIDDFKPIYVHCKAGVDRTGMVCAWFEMDKGMTRAEAISRMKKAGMHFWYYWWIWFL